MGYLPWPRRNRFATNPVGTPDGYVAPSNARILMTLMDVVQAPQQVTEAVLSPTPTNDAETETLIGVVSAPVVSAAAYDKKPSAATMTIASPCVVTYTAHGFAANQIVFFTTTGALPTGITASALYYIRNPAANTFELSTVSGGSSLTTSGTQNGTHSLWYRL